MKLQTEFTIAKWISAVLFVRNRKGLHHKPLEGLPN
jgi:hypothetical protein